MSVVVVTDSTSYLPEGIADELGIVVVPLEVIIDGRSGAEGVEVTPARVASALRTPGSSVTTSRPSPATFSSAYEQVLAAGADGIVSVHLSAKLSGTWEAARLGARDAGVDLPIRVVDSHSAAMGMGFGVLAAARAAAAGAGLDEVTAEAVRACGRTRLIFYVDTLEYLRRGGRLSATAAALGSVLSVKPLLEVQDGGIHMLEKVRTSGKALARLEALVRAEAGRDRVDLAVHHLDSAVRAFELVSRLELGVPGVEEAYLCDLGAVIGAHTGPGVVGVVVSHR